MYSLQCWIIDNAWSLVYTKEPPLQTWVLSSDANRSLCLSPPPANDWIRNKGLAFYRWIFPNSLSIKNAGIRADDVPDSPFTWEDALVFPTTPCSSICFIWLWTHGIMSCIMFEVDFILRSLRLEDTSHVRSKHKRSGITFMRLNVISIQYL